MLTQHVSAATTFTFSCYQFPYCCQFRRKFTVEKLPVCCDNNSSWHAKRFLSYVKSFYRFHSLIVFINALTHLQVRWWRPLRSVRVQTCTTPMKKWLEFYDSCKAAVYDIRGLKLYLAELLLSPFVENKRQVSAVWSLQRQVIAGRQFEQNLF